MNYPLLIKDVKSKGYCAAVSSRDIEEQLNRLARIPESEFMGNNLYNARMVRALLTTKLTFTILAEAGFPKEKQEFAYDFFRNAQKMYVEARSAVEPGSLGWAEKFDAIMLAMQGLMARANEIRKDFDRFVVDGAFTGTLGDFLSLKDKYSEVHVEGVSGLFFDHDEDPFALISVRKVMAELIGKKIMMLQDALFSGFSTDKVIFRDTIHNYDSLDTIPNLSLAQNIKDAPVLFISTPILEEFDILLNANLHKNGIEKILQIDLSEVSKKVTSNKDREYFSRMFLYLMREKQPNVIAVSGIEDYGDERKKDLFLSITDFLNFVSQATRIVLMDESGDMSALNYYNEVRKGNPSMVSADNKYLRLPSLEDAKEVGKYLSGEQLETVRKTCVFMGYRGLNMLDASKEEIGLAIESAKAVSNANKAKALAFLDRLFDDSKLVPLDWDYKPDAPKEDHSQTSGEDEYDYDSIRDVSDEQIKRIIANPNLDIYNKCGELVRYILLANEDKSIWKENLNDEERADRITQATHVVAYTMKVFYSKPNVEIVKSTSGKWGGLCCGGGETIKYKYNCVDDIAWIQDAILHELYHSLQFTLTDKNVDIRWYKRNFHISNERIESWRTNESAYQDLDGEGKQTLYFIQTMEVDARDFACLCLGDQVYHNHDGYRK